MGATDSSSAAVGSRLAALNVRRPQALALAIEESIAERALRPGTRLATKAELRRQYGVASTTVNEAIRLLEHRGVVVSKPGPGGGVMVAESSGWLALSQLVLSFRHASGAAAEALAVRDALEPLVAAEAAAHHRRGDLGELRRLLGRMERHVHDPARYLEANWAFHRRCARLCRNAFARSLYEGLLDIAEAELTDVEGRGSFDGTGNLAVHAELLEAIASREPERVAAAVREHSRAARVAPAADPLDGK